MKLIWLTDLHLEKVGERKKKEFFENLRRKTFDAVVVTGDISNAACLPADLVALGDACGSRQVYFVLGNHDFFGSRFEAVDAAVAEVCQEQRNLRHLGHGETIPIGANSALVGHRGWADGKEGYGSRTKIPIFDSAHIADLQGLSNEEAFQKMENLGKASARYFREVLPYALKCYEHLWIATHVPPFRWSAFYDGRLCSPLHLPHFCNQSAGSAIRGIAGQFPETRITVLCGHTHSPVTLHIGETITVHAGRVTPGRPRVQQVFDF